jgi:CHAT domain
VKTVQWKRTQLARDLRKAVLQQKWELAFRLAQKLSKPGISPAETSVLRYFERAVKKFVYQRTQLARDLRKAVLQQKWQLAFRLAQKLSQLGISPAETLTLRYFERTVKKFVYQASRSQNKPVERKLLSALLKFQRESTLFFFQSGKQSKGTPRGLKFKTARIERHHATSESTRRGSSRSSGGLGSVSHLYLDELQKIRSMTLHRKSADAVTARSKSGWGAKRPKTEIIERIPHMDLEPTLTEKRYQVFVFANTTPPDPGSEVKPVRVRLPKHISRFIVNVTFACSPHFRVDGPDTSQLVFTKSKPESSRASFYVWLREPANSWPMFFRALFRYQGRPSGKITRFLEYNFQAQDLSWKDSGPDEENSKRNGIKLPNDIPTSNVSLDFQARPSDIRIEVLKTSANDGRSFQLSCFTPAGDWKGPWNLPVDSEKLVHTHMDRFTQIQGAQSLARLQSAGIEFWNAVTAQAQTCLLKAFKNHKIKTISVLSEEPFIPWELMIPVAKGNPPVDCLGVTYSMGRWVTGNFHAATQLIPMKTAFIVAPEKSGLALASKEAIFLKKTLPGSTQIKPVTYEKLDEKLAASHHTVVHFICHGKVADLPTLKLDPEDVLDSSEILALKGFLAAFKKHPFTFLNACEVGQTVRSLDGLGGFANSFLHLGASAVVAPLWSVDDTVAEQVCKGFYNDALAGKTFGEAMKKIRAQAFASGTDTFASYCYYGDPAATAVRTAKR